MGIIGLRALNKALNTAFGEGHASGTRYPVEANKKKTIIEEIEDLKGKLSYELDKKNIQFKKSIFNVVNHLDEDGIKRIYFYTSKTEEELKQCWFDRDESYGCIDENGKVEVYEIGGLSQSTIDSEEEKRRVAEIKAIVESETELLQTEYAENEEFKKEKTFMQKFMATITGKKPKLQSHRELKEALKTTLEKPLAKKAKRNNLAKDIKVDTSGGNSQPNPEQETPQPIVNNQTNGVEEVGK